MMPITTTRIPPAPCIAVDSCGSGPAVMFLHGIGGNRSNWHDQLTALGDRYHALAWDARGYGGSDDYEGPLAFGDFSADLLRVLDALGIERVHLCGLSMGGMIAQDFYRRHPQRVRSLVLADTRNPFQRFNNDEFLRQREAPLKAGKTPRDIAPGLAPTLASLAPSQAVLTRLIDSVAALHKESYLKTLRATTQVAEDPAFAGAAGFVELATIKVPTLVICGSEDRVTPPAMSEFIAAGVAGAELVMIAGAGHLSNIEQPTAFNRAMRNFLDRVEGGEPDRG